MDLVFKAESYEIIGACFEVYNEIGCGFLENVYQHCLEIEFELRGIPFEVHKDFIVSYKRQPLNQVYKPDFVCFDKIIVELKSVSKLTDEHRAQLHNYLLASGKNLGLLVNFGHYPELEYERIVKTDRKRRTRLKEPTT